MQSGRSDLRSETSQQRAETRDQRLEIRCYAREKALLRKAAELDHRTLSNWLLYIALREARKVVAEHGGSPSDSSPATSPDSS